MNYELRTMNRWEHEQQRSTLKTFCPLRPFGAVAS